MSLLNRIIGIVFRKESARETPQAYFSKKFKCAPLEWLKNFSNQLRTSKIDSLALVHYWAIGRKKRYWCYQAALWDFLLPWIKVFLWYQWSHLMRTLKILTFKWLKTTCSSFMLQNLQFPKTLSTSVFFSRTHRS
jgi:hypothetical protein